MTIFQYKRLCLVLLLPLLYFGWGSNLTEQFISHNHKIYCFSDSGECQLRRLSANDLSYERDYIIEHGLPAIGSTGFVSGHLNSRFSEEVVLVSQSGEPVSKQLTLFSNGRGCLLELSQPHAEIWDLKCPPGRESSLFRFADKKVAARFLNISESLPKLVSKGELETMAYYTLGVFFPLIAFFGVSALLYVVYRIMRYIWFGSESAQL